MVHVSFSCGGHGVVQLTGVVSSDDQKQRAEQIARTVAGVTQVRNSIEVEAQQ